MNFPNLHRLTCCLAPSTDFPTVHFDTHQISKMDSVCELNAMSEEDERRLRNRELKKEMLDKIVESMRQCFGLTFFGVDVIIEDTTGNYVVIDINNFRRCLFLLSTRKFF